MATTFNDVTTFDIKKVNEVLLPEYRAAIATPTSVGKAAAVSDVVTNFPNYDETDPANKKPNRLRLGL